MAGFFVFGILITNLKGSPTIVVDGLDEESYIPLDITAATMDVLIYDKSVTVEVDGNYLLIPLEGEIERVCISEFNVKEIKDGQIILAGDINGWFVIVAAVVGLVAGGITIGEWLYDNVTSRDVQTIRSGLGIERGEFTTVRGFDFYIPRPLKGAAIVVDAFDVDRGETVIVTLIGGGHRYTLNRPLLTSGNNRTGRTFFMVDRSELDKMNDLFARNHGKVAVELRKTHGGGTVRIEEVGISVNW